MNRKLIFLSFMSGLFMFFSCADEALSPIITFDKAGKGAYVRLLQESEGKVINLFDPTNYTYIYSVEFVDLEKGELVSEYCLNLIVKDNTPDNNNVGKGPLKLKCYSASEFGTTANGFKGVENIKITSNELFALAGIDPNDLGPGDLFQIIGTVTTTDGATFGKANSSAAVNGSAFKGHFDYTFAATCPSNLDGEYPVENIATWCGKPGTNGTVKFNKTGAGVYSFSDWSLGSYVSCYGSVGSSWGTLSFTDVCNEVFFSGFTDNYGDTWTFTTSLEGDKWTITYVNTYGEGGTSIITNPSGPWPFKLRE